MNKESIVKLLEVNVRAVARAIVVLNERQTNDEQVTEHTRHRNGRGFRPCHARMGTSMAKFFQRNGYLTPKQIAYWRCRDATGSMRIGIYAGQLLEEAQNKASPVSAGTEVSLGIPVTSRVTGDLGNDMERKMILQEKLDDVLDSDDPSIIDPLANEIDEIEAFWAKVKALQGKPA